MAYVDPLVHDSVYRLRRERGEVGWQPGAYDDYFAKLDAWTGASRRPPLRVLELGCGAGDQSLWLASQGHTVTGIDVCPSGIAWARDKAAERGIKVEFHEGDVRDLPFASESFDWVLDGACWHCIVGEDRARFLSEAARVLRSGGVLTGASMVNPPCGLGGEGYDARSRTQRMGEALVRYYATAPELLRELVDASFRVKRYEFQAGSQGHPQDLLWVDAVKP